MTIVERSGADAQISRRRILQGAAWATPAILVATAIPATAASLAPATEPPGSWFFDNPQINYNDGHYDVKAEMRRSILPPVNHPKYGEGINAPYDGTAIINVRFQLDLNAVDGSQPFFAVDPLSPFTGPNAITIRNGTSSAWVFGAATYNETTKILSFTAVNNSDYVSFNGGRALQNLFVNIPTTLKDNSRPKDGSAFIALTYSGASFTTLHFGDMAAARAGGI